MELITEVTWKTFLTWATRNIPYGKRTIFCNFHFFTISSPFHIVFQNISVSKKTTCFCFGIQKLSLASLHHAKFDIVSFCGSISLLSTPWFGNIPTKEASREQKRSKQNLPAKILAGGGEWCARKYHRFRCSLVLFFQRKLSFAVNYFAVNEFKKGF